MSFQHDGWSRDFPGCLRSSNFITVNDRSDQAAPYDVIARKGMDFDLRQVAEAFDRIGEAIGSAQIALLHIAVNDHCAIGACLLYTSDAADE